jgi:CHAD domain-containing protein
MYDSTSTPAQTVGDWAYGAIATHCTKIRSHEAGVITDKDPEAVHQMRVGMRRLRSALAGFAPVVQLPKIVQRRTVSKVARVLGRLRDLDVLNEILLRYVRESSPAEQAVLKAIAKTTRHHHRKQFKAVRHTLTRPGKYQNLCQALQTWLDKPTYSPLASQPINGMVADLLAPQVSHFLIHPGFFLPLEQALAEVEQLHDLRKQAKETRYQLELFQPLYGEDYTTHLKRIKAIQSVLGNLQDGFVLEAFLSAEVKHCRRDLPEVMAQLERDRTAALSTWSGLQSFYTHPEHRQALRHTLAHPLPA